MGPRQPGGSGESVRVYVFVIGLGPLSWQSQGETGKKHGYQDGRYWQTAVATSAADVSRTGANVDTFSCHAFMSLFSVRLFTSCFVLTVARCASCL